MRQKTKTIMKKLLVQLLAIPLIGFSQTETKREYYESGKILSIIEYKDGARNGTCRYFHDYGAWAIKLTANYKNGKMIGSFKTYYKNGQVKQEGNYKFTEKGVCSRKDGVWKNYYENGQLQIESILKDGIQVEWKSYRPDGTVRPMKEDGC
jgi:antitoxin component YwqK of YwqJK toxin-antitoxin module